MPLRFPEGFLWGMATSAYQIEGSPAADGKGPSIWDSFCKVPGNIRNGESGDVAIDHYHRFQSDVALLRDLGVEAYRFSISWPRIFPDGDGEPNPAGLDFYIRLVDCLLEAGIRPFATLYHWDLPQSLQDRFGGWQRRETAEAFARYAGYVARKLSDRVRDIITINEFRSFVDMGYRGVEMAVGGRTVRISLAPGLALEPKALAQVRHLALLGHGLAVQAIRAEGRAETRVGPAENVEVAVPVSATPANIAAARAAMRYLNGPFLTPMLEGAYDSAWLAAQGENTPEVQPGDMEAIGAPLDFVGLNIYRPAIYVMAEESARGWQPVRINPSHPKMDSAWHLLDPEALYWGPRLVHDLWQPEIIYLTENGCAAKDALGAEGEVHDTDRLMYLRAAMTALHRAIADGAPVAGNFFWSAFDNFEWTDGLQRRFGLVHVDYETQVRTPKLSAHWFCESARTNSIA
ncbi:GH1 family beta-glucosidase [Thermaurantiacus sp.]